MVQINQMTAHDIITIPAANDCFYYFTFRVTSSPANLERGNDGNRFGLAYAPETGEFGNGCFGQFVQVVIIMMQDAFA